MIPDNKPTYGELVQVIIDHLREIAQEDYCVNVEDTAFEAELTMMNILCRLNILDFVTHDEAVWKNDYDYRNTDIKI